MRCRGRWQEQEEAVAGGIMELWALRGVHMERDDRLPLLASPLKREHPGAENLSWLAV